MNSELLRRRVSRALRDVDVSRGRGLEIGPLNAPFVDKAEADVRYIDVHPADRLRQTYASHPGFEADRVVEVDYWLIEEDRVRSMSEATAGSGPFDWAVASHVIEHVPDLVGWLGDVADVLVDEGLLCLVVPDRRFTFDALRPATSLGQVLQASHDRDARPTVRAVFDTNYYARSVPPKDKWSEDALDRAPRLHPPLYVREQLELAEAGHAYLDAHVWVWTAGEFLEQLAELAEMALVQFEVLSVLPTPDDEIEFYATLRRLPRDLKSEARRSRVETAFRSALDELDELAQNAPDLEPRGKRGAAFLVSPAEMRLVLAKRALIHWLLKTARAIRRRAPKP